MNNEFEHINTSKVTQVVQNLIESLDDFNEVLTKQEVYSLLESMSSLCQSFVTYHIHERRAWNDFVKNLSLVSGVESNPVLLDDLEIVNVNLIKLQQHLKKAQLT